MLVIERHRVILEQLRRKGAASVRDLAATLGSPEVTIRRDLVSMARRGLLNRTHGGAVIPHAPTQTNTNRGRWSQPTAEDVSIAVTAAEMIQPGDSIVLGGGAATLALAHELTSTSDLIVVTNSLQIAEALVDAPGIDLFITGGSLRRSTLDLVGPSAEQALGGLRPSIAFLSGDGLTARHGLSTSSFPSATADRAAAAASNRVIALVGRARIGRDGLCQIVPCTAIQTVITGAGADAEELQQINGIGVAVRIGGGAVNDQ